MDGKRKKPDIKKGLKRVGQGAAAAGLAVSLFFGGLFAKPAEIVSPDLTSTPPAIVQTEELPDYDAVLTVPPEEPERKKSFSERIKEWLQRLPFAVRVLIILPMWGVGFGILWLGSLLGDLIGIPVIGTIIKWIVGVIVIAGLIIFGEKILFPEVPVKKLASRKNLIALGVTASIIALAGAFGKYYWEDKPFITALIDIGAGGLYLLFLSIYTGTIKKKKAEY